jgi:hypothetical protein
LHSSSYSPKSKAGSSISPAKRKATGGDDNCQDKNQQDVHEQDEDEQDEHEDTRVVVAPCTSSNILRVSDTQLDNTPENMRRRISQEPKKKRKAYVHKRLVHFVYKEKNIFY